MRLVRFGDVFVNMDRVNSIEFVNPSQLAFVYYSAPLTKDGGIDSLQPDYTRLTGADAIALMHWLEENSEDAREPMMYVPTPTTEPAPGQEPDDIPF